MTHLRLSLGGDHAGRAWDARAIADAVVAELERGGGAAGLSLPPAGALALQLSVAKHVVSAAYATLLAAGRVEREGKALRVVAGAPSAGAAVQPAPALLKPVLAANRPARGTPGYVTLSSAFIDPRLIPTRELASCARAALRTPGLTTYAHVQGYLPLRALIAKRLRRSGIVADPAHILTTIGSQQVLDVVCRSLQRRCVATENPAYIAAKALFELSGVETVGLPVDPFRGIDLAAWRRTLEQRRPSLSYLTANFQNPTGYSYSSRELAHILSWSQELGFAILEDDWGSDMLPHSETKPTLRALGGDNVLYMNAFTKKTLPSLRVGFVVANEQTLPSLLQSKKLSINGSPALLEETLCHFIEEGHYDAYLELVQRELAARYTHCISLLRSCLPQEVRWTLPGGGPVLWLEFPRRVALDALIAELAERKVLVNPQDAAFLAAPHLHGFMLGYGFPDRAEMTTAIEILAELVKRQLR
jgi:DNA-binding transcriptional MocR family regulator